MIRGLVGYLIPEGGAQRYMMDRQEVRIWQTDHFRVITWTPVVHCAASNSGLARKCMPRASWASGLVGVAALADLWVRCVMNLAPGMVQGSGRCGRDNRWQV